ncbi:MAG: hypothetical protein ABSF09_12810 [Candidatus Bathyarchaeia archaeon]
MITIRQRKILTLIKTATDYEEAERRAVKELGLRNLNSFLCEVA